MHAEVRIGDAIVMLNDDFPEFGLPPVAEGRLRVTLHVYVPDVDSLWDRASSALRTPRSPAARRVF
jgi:PhnB protein